MVLKSNSGFLDKFTVHYKNINDLNTLRSKLEAGSSCHLCYKNFDSVNRRRRGNTQSKEKPKIVTTSESGTSLQKHIFAIVLSRSEVFVDESPQNHRFTGKSNFKICKICYMKCWKHFKNLDFTNETTDFFHFVCPSHISEQVSHPEIINQGPSQDQYDHDDSVQRLSQEMEQLGQNEGSHEPDSIEDPDSDLEFDYHPPPQRLDDDQADDDDNQSQSQSSSSDTQPSLKSLTYHNTKNKYISVIDCADLNSSNCVLCGTAPSTIEEVILIPISFVTHVTHLQIQYQIHHWN